MGEAKGERYLNRQRLARDNLLTKKSKKQVDDTRHTNMSMVVNGKLENTVSNICVGPNCFDILDDILLFSIFRDTLVLQHKGYNYGASEQIEVKVHSTVVSRETCAFEGEDNDVQIQKKLKESFFVGQVHRASEDCALEKGTSVTSLRRCPIHSRFVTLALDALIPIPNKLDIGEAAAVVSTFVPAMGMLHHGRADGENRFSQKSLQGMDILVTGGGTDEADAVVNLALLSGANRVFVLQSHLSIATYHARSVRVELVSDNPSEWYPVIDRYMDLIVDFEFPKNYDALYGILKKTGRLVSRKLPPANSWFAPLTAILDELSLLRYPNASMYNLDVQIENEHAEIVRDVKYLFRLLAQRKIRPKIDKYVKLSDIDSVREDMRRNPGSGAVVCETWRVS